MKRKIAAMHDAYGKTAGHVCKECCNFVCGRYHDDILRKCEAYGLTHSEASDWGGKYEACGLFGKPIGEYHTPMIEVLKHSRSATEIEPLPGQTKFEI